MLASTTFWLSAAIRPRTCPDYDRSKDAFRYACDLVAFIRSREKVPDPRGFGVGVAGFPEGHPATPNRLMEMDNFKRKVDAGVDYICTQLFFDNRDFYDFRERCDLAGIRVPIVAGIMPITSKRGMMRMAELAFGARIPAGCCAIGRCKDDEAVAKVGIHWATEQCRDLLHNNVRGIHFYTLNSSDATRRIYENLGVADSAALRVSDPSRTIGPKSPIRPIGPMKLKPSMPSRDELATAYFDQLPYPPYPVQEEALLAWFTAEQGVLVCAPTGTGKTLIAQAALYEALHTGSVAYYTTPLIALTEQKFHEMQAAAVRWGFSRDDVGLVTGNRQVNPEARILVVVAEILLNRLLHHEGFDFSNVSAVVMDEFHTFADPERGIVWELVARIAAQARFGLLLLSATVGNAAEFLNWLDRCHGRKVELVEGRERKVPLDLPVCARSVS